MDRLTEWLTKGPVPVSLSDIELDPLGIALTVADLKAGRVSKTPRPVDLWLNPANGKYRVLDGMHRIGQALGAGETTIMATISMRPGLYNGRGIVYSEGTNGF